MPTSLGPCTVNDLAAALGGSQVSLGLHPLQASVPILKAVVDSRLVTPRCLFIALRGQRYDGHNFIPEAVAHGAVAVIAERAPEHATWTACDTSELRVCTLDGAVCLVVPDSLAALQRAAAYWRRQHSPRVIAITGSVGKTTSKEVIKAVLSRRYSTLHSEGNYNNEIGLPLTLLNLSAGHERVVLEMGMYDLGEIAQLAEIALPHVGVVTNVGPAHLERLGTIERIAQAKAELPRALPSAKEGGVAILNADDEWVRAMAAQTRARVLTYGLQPAADLWADQIEGQGLEGMRFRLHHGQETLHVHVPLLGQHSVHTALRAAAVGLVEGLSWEEIMAGLRDPAVQLRLVVVRGPAESTILDDTYNSSPASCIAALNLLDELEGFKIAVLGDMYELGPYEQEGHKLVGRRARDVADVLVTVGRLGQTIGIEALKAGMSEEAVHMTETNAMAIELLQRLVGTGDRVERILVKGSRALGMDEIVAALTQPRRRAELGTEQSQP